MTMPRLRHPWLLSFASCLFALYAVEFASRYSLVRSLNVRPVQAFHSHIHTTTDYSVIYNYEVEGLRSGGMQHFDNPDLLLLGDSFVSGQGVNERDSLTVRLLGADFSVLNVAEISTGPVDYLQKLKMLEARGTKAQTIVVGVFIGNDFQALSDVRLDPHSLSDQYSKYDDVTDFLYLRRIRYVIRKSFSKIFSGFYVFPDFALQRPWEKDWILWFVRGNEETAKTMRSPQLVTIANDEEYLRRAEINPHSLDTAALALQAIAAVGGRLGAVRTIVFLIADLHAAKGELGAQYQQTMNQFASSLRQNKIDVVEAQFAPEFYFANDGHLNARGQEAFANLIVTTVAPTRMFAEKSGETVETSHD